MKLVIATKNEGKMREFQKLFAPLGVTVCRISDLCSDYEVEETGKSFLENAYLKAHAAMEKTGEIALADDSGLCVDALGGAPGIYSARYAGDHVADEIHVQKLLNALQNMKDTSQRRAHFTCAIVCCFPDGRMLQVEEHCEGQIGFSPAGEGGFGYDPVFLYEGKTFSQMPMEEKNQISHRGKAVRRFLEEWKRATR